jgi:hypothetical protein
MAAQALAQYHIGEQKAAVLLGTVEADLAVLAIRLAHYHDRLRMSDGDRDTIARARDLLARAGVELARLRGAGQGPRP